MLHLYWQADTKHVGVPKHCKFNRLQTELCQGYFGIWLKAPRGSWPASIWITPHLNDTLWAEIPLQVWRASCVMSAAWYVISGASVAITKWFWSFFANEHQDFDGSGHTVHCSQLSVLLLFFFLMKIVISGCSCVMTGRWGETYLWVCVPDDVNLIWEVLCFGLSGITLFWISLCLFVRCLFVINILMYEDWETKGGGSGWMFLDF